MRNVISTFLLGIGIVIIVVGFILGISFGIDQYGEFSLAPALYWWLSGIVSGFIFIGMSEIVNLLQKIVDKQITGSIQSQSPIVEPHLETGMAAEDGDSDKVTKINGLTILMGNERFKGSFWIDYNTLKVMKKSMFQTDSEAQLITSIDKNNISSGYEFDKEYLILKYNDSRQKIAFRTHTIHDYDRVIELLKK